MEASPGLPPAKRARHGSEDAFIDLESPDKNIAKTIPRQGDASQSTSATGVDSLAHAVAHFSLIASR